MQKTRTQNTRVLVLYCRTALTGAPAHHPQIVPFSVEHRHDVHGVLLFFIQIDQQIVPVDQEAIAAAF